MYYIICMMCVHKLYTYSIHVGFLWFYFWPSFCCKIPHDDHGGLGWFALGSSSDCTPGRVEPCSETTSGISLVRFWALMWSIFMAFLRTWASDPRKRSWFTPAHCTSLQTLSAHFSLRIGEPPLQYPFNFFTCRMAGQQCCAAAPSAPKHARGLSWLSFFHMVLWWTEITGSYGSRGCNVVTIKRCNVPEVPSEKWCRNILEAMPNFD